MNNKDLNIRDNSIWPRPVIVPVPTWVKGVKEPVISLNGKWQFAFKTPEQFWKGNNNQEIWQDINVPGECVMQGFDIEKDIEYAYRKFITIPSDFNDKKIILRFDGVYSYARVWVNGTFVRDHEGGFTTWDCDITNLVTPGETARIDVGVTDKSDEISKASSYAGHNIGGILRDVYLIGLPKNHIKRFHVETDFDSAYKNAVLRVYLNSELTEEVDVRLSLKDPQGQEADITPCMVTLTPDIQDITVDINVKSPQKWDAEHPNLYNLNADIISGGALIEKLDKKVGFRKVEVAGNKVLVNGKEVKLRGVNRHDVHPLSGRGTTREIDERDVILFKEANINFIRTSHYPPSKSFLEACDKHGMYVEEETAVCWINLTIFSKDAEIIGPEYEKQFMEQFSEMLERDRSHPSVIIWSLGNESAWHCNFEKEREYAKLEDPGRPVVFSFPAFPNIESGAPSDGYDIFSSHYPIWYQPMTVDDTDKPVLHDESIAVATHNRRTLKRDPGVRDYWGKSIKLFWDRMFNTEGCLGGAIWAAVDDVMYLPESINMDNKKLGSGEWGIVDAWRRQKPEYWHTKKAYSPIYIEEEPLNNPGKQKPLNIPITNRFDHTNLNEITIYWSVGDESGVITEVYLEPHMSGMLSLPPRDWKSGDTVNLEFHKGEFLIDKYCLTIGQEIISFPEPKGVLPTINEDSQIIRITANSLYEIVISKEKGKIISGEYKGSRIITGGPYINVTPHPLPEWQCTDISCEMEDDWAVVYISGTHGTMKVFFTLKFDGTGLIKTTYKIENPPEPMAESYLDHLKEGYTEIGVSMDLSSSIDRLAWKRDSLWSVYPEDHIGRAQGIAYRERKAGADVYREEPKWNWSQDIKSYLMSGFNDTKINATYDFISMKENIWYASACIKGSNNRIRVEGDGTSAVRMEVNQDNGEVRLMVNNIWSYQSLSVNNYTPIQAIDDGYENTVVLRLTDNDDYNVSYRDTCCKPVMVLNNSPKILYRSDACFNQIFYGGETRKSMWINRSSKSSCAGIVKYAKNSGEYVEFGFTGSEIKWLGPKGKSFGIAAVYVDNVYEGDIDCFSADEWSDKHILYHRTGLTYGKHTIRIVVKGEKNIASVDTIVGIDAFVYI